MNIYEHRFIAECPNNGAKISYALRIETNDRIMVEQLVEKCSVGTAFHEDLADAIDDWFSGRKVLQAFHHGVWITTIRGDV